MDLFDVIAARRAIKHYQPNQPMPREDRERIIAAALQSPTSFNIQHWRIVRVTDSAQRQALRAVAMDQAQVTDASELWIVCADINAWQNEPQRYWRHADADTSSMIVNLLTDFYRGKPQLQRDEAVRSCGIMAQTVMLSAKALGYDSCPMIGFDAEKVAEIIELPEGHLIGLMLAIGKAEKPAWPRSGPLLPKEVMVENRFAG